MANLLIIAVKYPVASARYMTDAFRRLGHTVYVLGPETGNKVWGIEVDPRHAWHEDFIPPGWLPDLCITMDTNYNPIVNYDCPHVIYTVDNHVRDVTDTRVYPHYDKYFMAHHDGPARPVCEDCGHIWLPCAADERAFLPSPIKMNERKYDLALCGFPYERRQKIVTSLQDAGLSVWAGLGPLYDEFASIYQNSKISLCVSACQDVAQRIFESAYMNCAILTDQCHDFDRLGFVDGKHGAIFKSDDDVVDMAKAMLSDLGTLDDMATMGTWWAIPNTWVVRAQLILDTMEIK